MTSTVLLSWVTFIYLAAGVFYLARVITGKDFPGRAATAVGVAGLALQTAALGLRWIESYRLGIGHAHLPVLPIILGDGAVQLFRQTQRE